MGIANQIALARQSYTKVCFLFKSFGQTAIDECCPQHLVESDVIGLGYRHQGIERGQPFGLRLGTSFQGSHRLALQGARKIAFEKATFPVGCSNHGKAGSGQLSAERTVGVITDDFDCG